MARIGEARFDENGKLNYGLPGDQTGQEVCISPFYISEAKPWTKVFRAKRNSVRESLARCMTDACLNENIGYAQYGNKTSNYVDRYGLYFALKTCKTMSRVSIPCNCDCSSLVGQCCILSGVNVSIYMSTSSEPGILNNTGEFDEIPFQKGMTLLTGDIMWRAGHTAIIVEGDAEQEKEDEMYSARIKSSSTMKKWASGAGPNTRDAAYITISKKAIGFTPSVIVAQKVGEILANTQYIRGQAHIYVADEKNNAKAGIAVGTAPGYFNPDASTLQIPVRFTDSTYMVYIYK